MPKINVMHLIDGLGSGGAERMALNFVNTLPRDRFQTVLCTSRFDGALSQNISSEVTWIRLRRTHRLDLGAIRRLSDCVRQLRIDVIHAHSTSLFLALAACLRDSRAAVVWHDHYGPPAGLRRNPWVYGPAARRADAVIAVSESLSAWIRDTLRVPESRVRYVPNFVCRPEGTAISGDLPGRAGARIACVAGIRPEKDLINLIQAMRRVVDQVPVAHLLIVGPVISPEYSQKLLEIVRNCELEDHITWLGERNDVGAILSACDIGVLSSVSEGFPVVLLEYGLARLAVVSTDVGQCGEVLDGGAAGLLVPSSDPTALASALLSLLVSQERRHGLGAILQTRVQRRYSAEVVLQLVEKIYGEAIAARRN